MTIEEKKTRLLNFFQDEYSFYNMKELEKLVPKRCPGISPMIVKELVQQMIDEDGLITVEKCGNINIYWCFKNQILQKMYDSCRSISDKIEMRLQEIVELKANLEQARDTDRCALIYDSDGSLLFNREELLQKNRQVEEEIKCLQAKYDRVSQVRWCDRKVCDTLVAIGEQMRKVEVCTDNIEILLEYLGKKYQIESTLIRRELEIPEEFVEFGLPFRIP